ncbi:helix-turn-helix domain-containing protein [Microbispora sp. NBC_01189]|uniref:helix-turn-helix domain-containing protein n=1 Tax=Microbispora sp. NBC_01189 TaxID=2903583 RepID=UPI002E12B779|nr:helix-turn-helix domain-containing protein [Microbispora sp. NBC_01189]
MEPFARRFTALIGQPPITFLTWWRMAVAACLLRETDAPLSGIAQQVGHTSEFAFAAAFKRNNGIAPGFYRKQRQPTGCRHRPTLPDHPRLSTTWWTGIRLPDAATRQGCRGSRSRSSATSRGSRRTAPAVLSGLTCANVGRFAAWTRTTW